MLTNQSRFLVHWIFLGALTTGAWADPYGPSSGDLLEACADASPDKAAYCVGYLKAYRDWYLSLANWHEQILEPGFRYCEPKGFDYLKMKNAVVDYLRQQPAMHSQPRIIGVSKALHAKWPCTNLEVKKIQQLLSMLGYYPIDKVDGLMSSRTRQAIARFQKDHGLKVDGKVGIALSQALLDKARALLGAKAIEPFQSHERPSR